MIWLTKKYPIIEFDRHALFMFTWLWRITRLNYDVCFMTVKEYLLDHADSMCYLVAKSDLKSYTDGVCVTWL